ncbi:COG4223 family protein [Kordiimonas laminariae]|uniref:COG4223 family protein n=1 Tax=Kordiimonas laminariae TaxID=2917717 RepID=UPI001FF1F3D0|nr:hypothetical protein [Kordiimonas laminariae]MCK0070330.1 hypothetical protein [Kordiimonas laminariae]
MAEASNTDETELPQDQNSQSASASEATEFIEAEIIEETVSSETPKFEDKKSAVVKTSSGKAGWITAGVLAAFVGGLFAAPYAEKQLIALGLLNEGVSVGTVPASVPFDSSALEAEIDALKASLATYKEILAQQSADITAANTARADLQRQLELAAASNPAVGNIDDSAQLVTLKADVERLTGDIARLSALNSEADPEVSQLRGALTLAKAENAQFKARLDAIENSVTAVQAGALEASPRGRLVLALVRLKDRVLAGLDFSSELDALRTDIADLPAIDQQLMGAEFARLETHSAGISPYISLVRDFDAAVSGALTAGEKADGGFLSSLFTSRRTDAGASGDDAVFLQAERRLAARDTAGALKALEALSVPVKEAMAPWTAKAKAYVEADAAVSRMIKAATNAGSPVRAGE